MSTGRIVASAQSDPNDASTFTTDIHPPVYPICPWHQTSEESVSIDTDVLGTAFFISDDAGIFITAKHVVVDYIDKAEMLRVIYVDDPPTRVRYLRLNALQIHGALDVAIGCVDVPDDVQLRHLILGDGQLAAGDHVSIFGFSNTKVAERPPSKAGGLPGLRVDWNPRFYRGVIDGLHAEGFGLASGPVYVHTAKTLGGISGGPMFRLLDSFVYGITSSGSELYGTATDLRAILDWPIMFLGNKTIRQLAQRI